MAEHTPGPWAYDTESNEVFATGDHYGAGWIARVEGNDSNGTPFSEEMRLANARLIAAAPELLVALKYMLGNAEADGWSEMMLADARSAIAKPEGRGE
jgi:hypothetical protein